QKCKLLPQPRGSIDARKHGLRQRRRRGGQQLVWPRHVVMLALEYPMQGTDAIAKAMYEGPGRFAVVAHLHERAGEIQVRDVRGLPFTGLGGDAPAEHQLRAASGVEDRRVEAKARARNYTVVTQIALDLVGAGKAEGNQV